MRGKAMSLLKIFNLEDEANQLASSLPFTANSASWKLHVHFSHESGNCVLDEPAAGMNPNETAELMETIKPVRDISMWRF